MLNKKISTPIAITIILVLVIIVGGFTCWQCPNFYKGEDIFVEEKLGDFEKCVSGGYSVTGPYPRQCKTPEGEVFVEEKVEEGDDWGSPFPADVPIESITDWEGIIISIDEKAKILKAGAIPEITIYITDKTEIKGTEGIPLLFSDLKIGDVISVLGDYQMRGKFTDDWAVRINEAYEITFIGRCIEEGGKGMQCCPGLTRIGNHPDYYCTKCGDSVCNTPENEENCPLDCVEVGQPITLLVFPATSTIDSEQGTFEAEAVVDGSKIKIIATDSVRCYSSAYWKPGEGIFEEFTLEEFFSKLKNWTGPMRGISVKGVLQDEDTIMADELFYSVQ